MSQITKYEPSTGEIISQPTSIFTNNSLFDQAQRVAKMLAHSTLVPEQYRISIQDKRSKNWVDNPAALSNCLIALNIAHRTGEDPMMVMQNLDIIGDRPAWNSKYTIARLNRCGIFSELEFEFEELGKKQVEYTETEWVERAKQTRTKKAAIEDKRCRAYATKLKTGKVIYGPWVSIEIAVKEGWYSKNGSKWQTMPDLMLMYRAAKWFANVNAPEVLIGIPAADEVVDIDYSPVESSQYAPALESGKAFDNLPDVPLPDEQPQSGLAEEESKTVDTDRAEPGSEQEVTDADVGVNTDAKNSMAAPEPNLSEATFDDGDEDLI